MKRFFFLLLTATLCLPRAQALASHASFPRVHSLNGFAEKVAGEILSYWSFHSFAKQSLLTRCTTGEMAIEWRTEPLPPSKTGDTLSFLWIGAFATGTSAADHGFDLFVNGQKSLTFRTFKGGKYENWSVPGAKGVVLSYKHVWTDHVNDAHGYFSLRVPAGSFPARQPLTLKVVGHKEDSRDWYMTFMYAVKESVMVRPIPMLVREDGAIRQPIEISVDTPGDRGTLSVSMDGSPAVQYPLKLGWNAVRLSVPAVEHERAVPLTISISDGPATIRSARVKPVRHRTLWLLPHSHNDIGYSDLQTTVLNIQVQNIRDALHLIEKTRSYPEGSRFKWNVEVLWPIDTFLVRASTRDKEAFLHAVKSGDIGLNSLYVNPLTGISRPEALIRLTDYARQLEREYGLRIPAAMISDIPGYIWSTVPALAQGGTRYFVSGPNSGDRIGHFTRAWGDKPFYWVGPSGKDSVLFWVAGTGYSLFHATNAFATNTKFLLQLQDYLEQLEATNYPYDIVQMRYSLFADNGGADSTMPDFVRAWNLSHVSPTLRIATVEEMCTAFEKQHGARLPSFAGDITPHWEDGAASTAAELGMAERASERLVQAEIVTSMVSPGEFDRKAFADAWNAVNLWNEHTWGAWNSVSDPDNPGVLAQWKIKQGFAQESRTLSQELLGRQTSSPNSAGSNVFEVINTCTWPRTDLIFLNSTESSAGDLVVDERGQPVASQRLTDGRLVFRAQGVPALGSMRYTVRPGPASQVKGVTVKGWSMQNQSLRVAIDSTTGAVRSVYDISTGRELVPDQIGEALNSVIVVAGTDPSHRTTGGTARIRAGEKGPLLVSLISEATAPGIHTVTREVSLVDDLGRIDIQNTIEKQAVREKEAVYFGFHLNVPAAVTRLDLGWGYIRPELDQLPGSCKDFFSVQRWVDVSGPQGGVTWATSEAPLVSLGELVDERFHNSGPAGWKTRTASSPLLHSWVMNNYWHTNYKADQEGRSSYRYSLKPHRGFDPVEAYRFGIEHNQPLIVRRISATAPRPGLPFRLRSASVTATTVFPAPDADAFVVRLYNPSPASSGCEIVPSGQSSLDLYESSAAGEKGRKISQPLEMGPFEIRTVRIE